MNKAINRNNKLARNGKDMCAAKKLEDVLKIILHRLSIMDNLKTVSASDLCKAKSI